MFFFWPAFQSHPAVDTGLTSQNYAGPRRLPAVSGTGARDSGTGLAPMATKLGAHGVSFIRHTLSQVMGSLTALGNWANACFTQIAAALAYRRMMRAMTSISDVFWPGSRAAVAAYSGPWGMPMGSPFAFSGQPWVNGRWFSLVDMTTAWVDFWHSAVWSLSPTASRPKTGNPFGLTVSVPGFRLQAMWG